MTEPLLHKQQLLHAYLAAKGAELDNRGRDFLELLIHRTAALEKMHFTKNAYYLRDRVLVGTSRYYSPRFYFRLGSFNINIENIHLDNKPSKLRSAENRRNSPVSKDIKPEHIFRLLEQLSYWFLQIDEDFAEQHHIGEGFTTQRLLESPWISKLFTEVEKSVTSKENRRRVLMLHIDRSLAEGNKQLFIRLTTHLKKLTG